MAVRYSFRADLSKHDIRDGATVDSKDQLVCWSLKLDDGRTMSFSPSHIGRPDRFQYPGVWHFIGYGYLPGDAEPERYIGVFNRQSNGISTGHMRPLQEEEWQRLFRMFDNSLLSELMRRAVESTRPSRPRLAGSQLPVSANKLRSFGTRKGWEKASLTALLNTLERSHGEAESAGREPAFAVWRDEKSLLWFDLLGLVNLLNRGCGVGGIGRKSRKLLQELLDSIKKRS